MLPPCNIALSFKFQWFQAFAFLFCYHFVPLVSKVATRITLKFQCFRQSCCQCCQVSGQHFILTVISISIGIFFFLMLLIDMMFTGNMATKRCNPVIATVSLLPLSVATLPEGGNISSNFTNLLFLCVAFTTFCPSLISIHCFYLISLHFHTPFVYRIHRFAAFL